MNSNILEEKIYLAGISSFRRRLLWPLATINISRVKMRHNSKTLTGPRNLGHSSLAVRMYTLHIPSSLDTLIRYTCKLRSNSCGRALWARHVCYARHFEISLTRLWLDRGFLCIYRKFSMCTIWEDIWHINSII